MTHYIDQCKTDLSSSEKHLHELRKRALLLERLRYVKPKYESDEKSEKTDETEPVHQVRPFSLKQEEKKSENQLVLTSLSDHLCTPPKNPSFISHNPRDSPADNQRK